MTAGRKAILALLALSFPALVLTSYALAAPPSGAPVELLGEIHSVHTDDLEDGRSTDDYFLRTDTGDVPLSLDPKSQHLRGKVRVTGLRLDDGTVLVSATEELVDRQEAPAPSTKRVAVLLLNFSNDRTQPWSLASVRNTMFQAPDAVSAYFAEESYGQLTVTGDVFGWFEIAADNSGCATNVWGAAADSAAAAAGIDLSQYTNVMYAWPRTSSCPWDGTGHLPGRYTNMNGIMTLKLAAHELSHNFGVHHASSVACTSGGMPVWVSNACSSNEYGDPFDVMGSGVTRHSTNFHRAQLGWFDSEDTLTVTSNGTYTLGVVEEESAVPKALRVRRSDGSYYQLEFRRPYGQYFDNFVPSDPVVNGVTIRLAPEYAMRTQTRLLDTTPGDGTFANSPLRVGETVTDAAGISFRTMSVSPTGASVRIVLEGSTPSLNWAAQNSVDFDADHLTDFGLYRGLSPADSLWYAPGTAGGAFQIYFGATSDIPVPGDYDGDGKTDAVIYRPSTGLWYGPRTGAAQIVIQMTLGQPGDIPIPGDYDGDGDTDPAIYRPSSGLFFGTDRTGATVLLNTSFGSPGDVPVPRDYDGDGETDPGIYRADATPEHYGLWYAPLSGGGVHQIYFGAPGDVPVPGDYDGDAKADSVIFRPSTGLWYGPRTGAAQIVIQMNFGQSGDVPIPGYYDGNLATDPAIYRPSTGLWFSVLSGGGTRSISGLGTPTDKAIQKRPALAGGV